MAYLEVMTMAMIIKILIISGLGLTMLATVPDLFIPLSVAIDSVFNSQLSSFMTTIYSTIPSDLMDLLTLQMGALAIYIIIKWIIGDKTK